MEVLGGRAAAGRPAAVLLLAVVTAVTILPLLMGAMDSSIANVGFGVIGGALGVSVDEVTAIATAYTLAMLVVMPLSGWLGANVGRKRSFVLSIALFTVASLGCAFSSSLEQLIAWRLLQGLGAGAMQTMSSAVLLDAYPPRLHARAFQIWGMGIMVGPLLGPLVGGWVLASFPWQFAFLINVPIGIVTVALAVAFLPDVADAGERSRFDWLSLALLAAGLASTLFALQEGPHRDWFGSPSIVIATIAGVVMLSVFVIVQLAQRVPLVQLRLMRIPSFSVALLLATVSGIGLTGNAFIVPLYMQSVLGFDPVLAGLGMIPAAVASLAGIQLGGIRAAQRIPATVVTAIALALLAIGTVWIALLGGGAGFEQIIIPRALQGLGGGLFTVPLNLLVMRDIPSGERYAAAGLAGVTRQIAISVGYAGVSAVLAQTQLAAQADYASRIGSRNLTPSLSLAPIRGWLIAHGFSAADATQNALPVFQRFAYHAAAVASFGQMLFWMAAFFTVTIPVVLLVSRGGAAKEAA